MLRHGRPAQNLSIVSRRTSTRDPAGSSKARGCPVRSGPIGRIDSCSRVNLFSPDDRFGIASGNDTLTPSGPRERGSPSGEGVPPRRPIPGSEFRIRKDLSTWGTFSPGPASDVNEGVFRTLCPSWNSFRHFSIASITDGPARPDRPIPWRSGSAKSERERRACRLRLPSGVRRWASPTVLTIDRYVNIGSCRTWPKFKRFGRSTSARSRSRP